MRTASLVALVRRDLARGRGALVGAVLGLVAGVAALVFFVALGLGVRRALFGNVFALDRVELEPRSDEPGLLTVLVGGGAAPVIDEATLETLRRTAGVARVFPKLRFAFPAMARGGKSVLGHDFTIGEVLGDGIDPALVGTDRTGTIPFEDPMRHPGAACTTNAPCKDDEACDRPNGAAFGVCLAPVPVLVSPYLVELFDRAIAPAHHLPPVARAAIEQANGVIFDVKIGESYLGRSKLAPPRTVRARIVGLSSHALDLGATMPLETVRRWNAELAGETSTHAFSSVLVEVDDASKLSSVVAAAEKLGLQPHDTRARDVAVLVSVIVALLSLVGVALLAVAASNIAQTFHRWATERRAEIALYRALGATRLDVQAWLLTVAAVVGATAGVVGVVVARTLAAFADRLARANLPDFPFKPTTFFAFPFALFAAGVAFAVVFALLGAIGPSRKAARTDPVRALAAG